MQGGSLPRMVTPVRYGIGSALGSGQQYVSWIHINDICGIILKVIQDTTLEGVYNVVAPNPVTNNELMSSIAESLNKPYFMPNVPAFVLKFILGEFASGVLGSSRVSSERIQNTGYEFEYAELKSAIEDLLK